jgi:hypothetical protein
LLIIIRLAILELIIHSQFNQQDDSD